MPEPHAKVGSALLFNQDPELGNRVVSCIKKRIEQSDFLVNAVIPEQLGRKISAYLEKNANRFMLQQKGF